jgi:hypothetical protein
MRQIVHCAFGVQRTTEKPHYGADLGAIEMETKTGGTKTAKKRPGAPNE